MEFDGIGEVWVNEEQVAKLTLLLGSPVKVQHIIRVAGEGVYRTGGVGLTPKQEALLSSSQLWHGGYNNPITKWLPTRKVCLDINTKEAGVRKAPPTFSLEVCASLCPVPYLPVITTANACQVSEKGCHDS